MILINSLYILPHHPLNRIIIYDNLQAQEIMKLNNKPFNTVFNIVPQARKLGLIYTSTDPDGIKKWYIETKNTTYDTIEYYSNLLNTTYYLEELEHYWLCPDCLCAVPNTWNKCLVC